MPSLTPLTDKYLGSASSVQTEQEFSTPLTDKYLGVKKSIQPTIEVQSDNTPSLENRGVPENKPEGFFERFAPTTRLVKGLKALPAEIASENTELPKRMGESTKEAFKAGVALTSSGLGELKQGEYGPTISTKPEEWKAGGILKTIVGPVAAAMSPVTGISKELVEKPVSELTGSKEIGERTGLVVGSALPISPTAKVISKSIPTNKAVNAIVESIGVENIPKVIQQLKENPRLSLMDVSLPTRQIAQKLVVTEGRHQNKFEKFIEDRIGTAKDSVENIYNNTMGAPVDVLNKLNEYKQAAENVGSKEINPAITNAKPVDVANVISYIDDQLKPGVQSIITAGQPLPFTEIKNALSQTRKLLTDNKSVRTKASDLNQFQSALRAKADDLTNSASGQERQIGYALMNVRNKIVDAIDEASEGTYKPALSKYRDEKQIEDAFIKGSSITRNRPGQWDDRPEFWKQWIGTASKEELEAAREGARVAVDQQINGMRSGAKRGEAISDIEFNKERLSLLFGRDEINQMSKKLREEKSIADTNVKLIEGSQTAQRLKAHGEVDLPVKGGFSPLTYATGVVGELAAFATGLPTGIGVTMIGLKGAQDIGHKIKLFSAKTKNERLSDMLTSTGKSKEELIKILSSYAPSVKTSLVQRAQNFALPAIGP